MSRIKEEIWECRLGEDYESDWDDPWVYKTWLFGDQSGAAVAFAEYAWGHHDMWECSEGFTVLVRRQDEPETVYQFQIEIEAVPSFNATLLKGEGED